MAYECLDRVAFTKLANAVVDLAARDYMEAVRKMRKEGEAFSGEVVQLERWFCSDAFSLWTDLDGSALLEKLRQVAEHRQTHRTYGGREVMR